MGTSETVRLVVGLVLLAGLVVDGLLGIARIRHARRVPEAAWTVAGVSRDSWLYWDLPTTLLPFANTWYLLVTRRRLDRAAARVRTVREEVHRRERGFRPAVRRRRSGLDGVEPLGPVDE